MLLRLCDAEVGEEGLLATADDECGLMKFEVVAGVSARLMSAEVAFDIDELAVRRCFSLGILCSEDEIGNALLLLLLLLLAKVCCICSC